MKWIDCKDRLPDVGMQKPSKLAWLITDGKSISLETMHPSYWNESYGHDNEHDGPIVTHWMPLPELPHVNQLPKGVKLTYQDVIEVRRLLVEGMKHADIAWIYGVHRSTITRINTGARWADTHVERYK